MHVSKSEFAAGTGSCLEQCAEIAEWNLDSVSAGGISLLSGSKSSELAPISSTYKATGLWRPLVGGREFSDQKFCAKNSRPPITIQNLASISWF